MVKLKFVFNKDRDCNLPHCWVRHLVSTGEAIEAWYKGTCNESAGYQGALMRQAVINNGREIVVVFRWLVLNEKIKIITAYDFNKEAYYDGSQD